MLHTKGNMIKSTTRNKGYYFLYHVIICIITAFLFLGATSVRVEASAGLKIYDYTTKKTSSYSGKLPKVTLNGTRIDKDSTPGLLVDGIALLPYFDVFCKSDIAADCVYDTEKGTLSISKYGIDINMKIGSKNASVNGKPITLPAAPMKIKYVASGRIKVLIPSRFVSEALGLGYTWQSDSNTVSIKKYTIQLSYNDAEAFEYEGIQGKVIIDGIDVDLKDMPSVITHNTAMLRAKRVFSDSAIDADYNFDNVSKKITLSKGDTTLVMTIGDNTAYLNDAVMKLDTAPIIVTNHETGSSFVMIPGGFTADSLGYDYRWDNVMQTSVITTRKADPVSDDSDTGSEQGDNDTGSTPGTALYNWTGNDTLYSACSGVHDLDDTLNYAGNGFITNASRDYSNMKSNTETFMITASAPFGKVTSESLDNQITIDADNLSCFDQTYQMYGMNSNFVNTISSTNKTESVGAIIKFDMVLSDYQYDISLSADKYILYVTVYKNCITSASLGVNADGDYITLNGIDDLKVTITPQNDFLYLDLPNTVNGLGDLFNDIAGTKYIKQLYIFTAVDKTQIIMNTNPGYEYNAVQNGSQYTISFKAVGETAEEETPVVIDKSRYEIVIPKSPDITKSMISDEDFYFNNYFVIRLTGDYTGFYNTHSITYQSNTVQQISVSLNGNGETEIKIATSKLQGYEIASDTEAIYVHIGNPRDIYKNIVVLDPGHGGGANGAQSFDSKEKDINLKILYTIGKKYFNSDTSKLKVYYTRTSDVDMSLADRAAFAKKVGADLFVSLHMNAVPNAPNVHGTEVFYSAKNNTANNAGLRSQDLAAMMDFNLHTAVSTLDRGVKTENYTVIYRNTVPAILIELGFITNKDDYALLSNEEFEDNAVKTIYETLLQVFEAYPTGR